MFSEARLGDWTIETVGYANGRVVSSCRWQQSMSFHFIYDRHSDKTSTLTSTTRNYVDSFGHRTRTWLGCIALGGAVVASVTNAVASTTSFYVSPNGNDNNDGSEAAPFATFSRAQLAMQGSSIKSTKVESGTYFFTSPLTLSNSDSGEAWLAASDAHPIISGGQVITGWTSQGGTVYSAPAANPVGIDLSINGRRQHPADAGYNPKLPFITGWRLIDATKPACMPNQNNFSNCFYALPGDIKNVIVGSTVQVMDVYRYTATLAVVTAVDQSSGMITTSWPYFLGLTQGSWRLLGNPMDISALGDFGYAPGGGGELGMVTIDVPHSPDSDTIIAAMLPSLIIINGASNITISGMTLQDTTTSYGSGGGSTGGIPMACTVGAIVGSGVTDVSITNNTFVNVGNGIYFCGSTNGNFSTNKFVSLDGVGLRLEATLNGQQVAGSGNRIVGNTMVDLGEVSASSTGVDLAGEAFDVIDSNAISGSGSHAVGVSGGIGNAITNNRLFSNSQQTDDSGSVYAYNGGGTEYDPMQLYVAGNRIENLGGLTRDVTIGTPTSGVYSVGDSRSVYFDDHVSTSIATKNVTEAHSEGIFLCHGCIGNSAVNNLVVIQPQAYYRQVGEQAVVATPDMDFTGRTFVEALPSYFPAGVKVSSITWQLSGVSSNGQAPKFEVELDGKKIGSGSATSEIADYSFNAKVAPYTEHQLTLVLKNGARGGSPTQSLHNISLFIDGIGVPLQGPPAKYPPYGFRELVDNKPVTDVTIESNIVYRSIGQGVDNNFGVPGNYVDPDPGPIDYDVIFNRKLVFEDSSPHLNGEVINTHSILADPRLANPAVGDYRLLKGSPALSRGFSIEGIPLAPP